MIYEKNTDRNEILSNMVEVEFENKNGFNQVRETLERMGVTKKGEKNLYQTAHILHKQGRYYIAHFKEMLAMDGKSTELSETDIGRRNLIVRYLREWGQIKDTVQIGETCSPSQLKIVKYSERPEWNFVTKYTIGTKFKKSGE